MYSLKSYQKLYLQSKYKETFALNSNRAVHQLRKDYIECPKLNLKKSKRRSENCLTRDLYDQELAHGDPLPFSFTKTMVGYASALIMGLLIDLSVKNSYPLLRIDGLLDQMDSSQYFSVIDLRSRYHQIRIAEEDIPKIAFT